MNTQRHADVGGLIFSTPSYLNTHKSATTFDRPRFSNMATAVDHPAAHPAAHHPAAHPPATGASCIYGNAIQMQKLRLVLQARLQALDAEEEAVDDVADYSDSEDSPLMIRRPSKQTFQPKVHSPLPCGGTLPIFCKQQTLSKKAVASRDAILNRLSSAATAHGSEDCLSECSSPSTSRNASMDLSISIPDAQAKTRQRKRLSKDARHGLNDEARRASLRQGAARPAAGFASQRRTTPRRLLDVGACSEREDLQDESCCNPPARYT
mmetsp:Transcript_12805/g.25318  ORF Transcript_12805/g.25318 Transcript_12805/m.25318 type:complete len:266 (+) Transcript_12805:1-798(+)